MATPFAMRPFPRSVSICYSRFRGHADTEHMTFFRWGDSWFGAVLPPLLAAQVAVLVIWAAITLTSPAVDATLPAPASTTSGTQLVGNPPPAGSPSARRPRTAIVEGKGRVGDIRIGMRVATAQARMGERLITMRKPTNGSHRFEAVAPTSGLTIAGTRGRIDTITVTNTGNGTAYRTARGVAIGSAARAVGRAYPYAIRVCESQWWLERGRFLLQIEAGRRVTSITLTSRTVPQFVDCL